MLPQYTAAQSLWEAEQFVTCLKSYSMTVQPYSWVLAKKKYKLKFTESARGFGYFYLYFVKPTYNPDVLQQNATGRRNNSETKKALMILKMNES